MKVANQHTNQLINRCKKGDKKAQFAIYKQYYKAMFNTALRIVNNKFEAEDIMQNSFLAAFTKLESFSGTVSFGAWLKKIVINNSLSALKKNRKIEIVSLEKVSTSKMIEDTDNDVSLDVSVILGKISQLKDSYRIALTLHLIEGYDYKEIAQILDTSYENSRTCVSRAKNKLRKLLHNNE